MRYILLAFKNIKKFVLFHLIVFVFLLTVQIICMIVAFITVGMLYNLFFINRNSLFSQYIISFTDESDCFGILENPVELNNPMLLYNGEEYSSVKLPHGIELKEFRSCADEFMRKTDNKKISRFVITACQGKEITAKDVLYPNGFLTYVDGYNGYENSDNENIMSDKNVLLLPYGYNEYTFKDSFANKIKVGKKYEICGNEYLCSGYYEKPFLYRNMYDEYTYIPYNSMPDEFLICDMTITFSNYLTETDSEYIKKCAEEIFGERITDMQFPVSDSADIKQLTQIIFIISALMIVLVILAIAKLYHFILGERKDDLAVLRLCGCSRGKAHLVYMFEITLTMVFTAFIGFAVFSFFMFEPIASLYPSFDELFNIPVCFAIIAVYFALSILIMSLSVIPVTKATISDMKQN